MQVLHSVLNVFQVLLFVQTVFECPFLKKKSVSKIFLVLIINHLSFIIESNLIKNYR